MDEQEDGDGGEEVADGEEVERHGEDAREDLEEEREVDEERVGHLHGAPLQRPVAGRDAEHERDEGHEHLAEAEEEEDGISLSGMSSESCVGCGNLCSTSLAGFAEKVRKWMTPLYVQSTNSKTVSWLSSLALDESNQTCQVMWTLLTFFCPATSQIFAW